MTSLLCYLRINVYGREGVGWARRVVVKMMYHSIEVDERWIDAPTMPHNGMNNNTWQNNTIWHCH